MAFEIETAFETDSSDSRPAVENPAEVEAFPGAEVFLLWGSGRQALAVQSAS